jgi:hypothetical protein
MVIRNESSVKVGHLNGLDLSVVVCFFFFLTVMVLFTSRNSHKHKPPCEQRHYMKGKKQVRKPFLGHWKKLGNVYALLLRVKKLARKQASGVNQFQL